MKLSNRVAIVTGASSGMGKAIAELYAQEGAKVVAIARRMDKLESLAAAAQEKGQVIVPMQCDVSSLDDIKAVVAETVKQFGTVDILVNNAGIMDNVLPLGELTDEMWNKIIAVNLTAPMHFSREVLPFMLKQNKGAIINVASVGGLRGSRGGMAYVTSKHGLVGMTKNIGFVYADQGIRCNVICPGGVDTEIGNTMSQPSQLGLSKLMSGVSNNPRNGAPEEIATVALFLASDDSSFVNGTSIVADSGWIAY